MKQLLYVGEGRLKDGAQRHGHRQAQAFIRRSARGAMTSTGRRRTPILDGAETVVAAARVSMGSATRATFRYMKGRVMRTRKLQVGDVED